VEVKTDVAGHEDFIANQRHEDLYACIDLVMDRADRQITDWKSKIRDHRH
jgi:ribosome-associated translation inhibitor RaiA